MTDLWIPDVLKKLMMMEMTKYLKKKRRSKQVSRNSSKENVMCAEKSVTKVQIVGRWKATKRKDLPDTTTKMMGTEITSSMAIVTL